MKRSRRVIGNVTVNNQLIIERKRKCILPYRKSDLEMKIEELVENILRKVAEGDDLAYAIACSDNCMELLQPIHEILVDSGLSNALSVKAEGYRSDIVIISALWSSGNDSVICSFDIMYCLDDSLFGPYDSVTVNVPCFEKISRRELRNGRVIA